MMSADVRRSLDTHTKLARAGPVRLISPTSSRELNASVLSFTNQLRSCPSVLHVNMTSVSPGQSAPCLREELSATGFNSVMATKTTA